MGAWGTISKAPNINLNNTNFPAVWEDSGKVYCKGQGEYNINVYDIATDSWSNFYSLSESDWHITMGYNGTCHELLWVYNDKLYLLSQGAYSPGNQYSSHYLTTFSITTKTQVNQTSPSFLGSLDGSLNGDWGRDKHKSIVKTLSGRIFIINWTLKQMWEFLPLSGSFINSTVSWPGSGSWLTSASGSSGPTACSLGDDIYLIGSSGTDSLNAHSMYKINTSGDMGTTACNLNVMFGTNSPQPGIWPKNGSFFSLGNTIFWYGGTYNSSNNFNGYDASQWGPFNVNYLMTYIPLTNTWTRGPALSTSPYINQSVITTSSSAIFFGGTISGSASKSSNAFTYLLDTPTLFQGVYNAITMAVDLTWVDNSSEETNYILERKRDDELTWSELAVLAANTTTYTDSTVAIHSHFYNYRISCEKAI
jgi:hypothetical protein